MLLVTDVMSASELQKIFETSSTDIPRASYELIFLVLRDQIDASLAAQSLANLPDDTAQQVVDTIWLVSNEIKHFGTLPIERLHTFVRALAKELPNSDMLLRQLPPDVLSGSQVLSDDRVFLKKLLRANTRNLYVQKKYNLLHEESEGYAKLVTELSGAPSNDEDEGNGLAQRITSLIGHFNLDPNRVEDLVLEALELNVDQSSMYMPLIRMFRKNRLCHLVGHKFHIYQVAAEKNDSKVQGDESSSSSSSSSSNSSSSSTSSWTSSASTSTASIAPESLYRLAAVLIASGDLSASELLPHLAPSNNQLREERQVHELFVLNRAKNLGKKSLGEPEEKLKKAASEKLQAVKHAMQVKASSLRNQKFGILSGMLDIGAWDAAVQYIKYLKTAGANPNSDRRVIAAGCSFCSSLLSKVYAQLPARLNPSRMCLAGLTPSKGGSGGSSSSSSSSSDAASGDGGGGSMSSTKSGGSSSTSSSSSSSSSSSINSVDQALSAATYAMDIPTTLDLFASTIAPVFKFIGEGIATDLVLFSKVCRILRHIVEALPDVYSNEIEKTSIQDIVVNVLLPGLAMVQPGNVGITSELWRLLQLFPYGERYRAYAKLKSDHYSLKTTLVLRRAEVLENTKKKFRRLAAETIKQQGRHLGKLAHSNPVVVFTTVLDQVEVYDNMIPTVVDCLKYMSELSYDVLSFILIDKLASSRDKLKGDGVNIANWLTSLATFAGMFYRRYPNTELRGILQYLINCLEAKRSLDLIVFREMISKMSGIQVIDEISHDMLQGRSGGLVLRAQTNILGRFSGSMRKSANALHEAVIGKSSSEEDDDTSLCVVLLVLLAQQRSNIILDSSSQQLKLIGRMYDECHMTMMQFVDFLSVRCATASNNSAAEASASYCSVLPSITVLLDTYKMQPGVAFTITRPSFSSFLRKGGLLTKSSAAATAAPSASSASSAASVVVQGQSPVCDEVLLAVRQSLHPEVWQSITPCLYSVFWSLSLYDIYTPSNKYERAKTTLQQAIQRSEKEGRTLSDQNSKAARELRREQRSKKNAMDDMNTEFRIQKDNERAIRRWLQQQKSEFLQECERIELTPQSFLQHCILPRALCSPEDAYFCAIFASILNDLQTPRWSSLNYYDKLNRCLASVVYCVTEREAANLGIFLQETLRLLERWTNPRIYTNECASKPGFNTSIRQASDKRATHDQYVKIFGKWHSKVSGGIARLFAHFYVLWLLLLVVVVFCCFLLFLLLLTCPFPFSLFLFFSFSLFLFSSSFFSSSLVCFLPAWNRKSTSF